MEEKKKETVNGYYQLCPKCLGEGTVPNIGISSASSRICPLCYGAKTFYHPPVILSSLISALEKEIENDKEKLPLHAMLQIKSDRQRAFEKAISLVKQTMKTE